MKIAAHFDANRLINPAHVHGRKAARRDQLRNRLPRLRIIGRVEYNGAFRQTIDSGAQTGGIKGEMPAYSKQLNEAEVRALIVYLKLLPR